MPIRQRGNSWQVDVRKKGRMFRHNYQTQDQANIMLVKVEDAISQGRALPDPEDCNDGKAMTIDTLFRKTSDKYWSDTRWGMQARGISEDILNIVGHNLPISKFNEEVIDDVVSHFKKRGNSNACINTKLSVISKALNHFAFKRGHIESKLNIEWLPVGKGRIRFVSEGEEASMHSLLTQWGMIKERDLFMFLIDTGMRVGESFGVSLRDLNENRLTIWVTKNAEPRTIVLTTRALEIFKRWEGNLSISRSRLRTTWDRMKVALGFSDDEDFVPHCLRHTCASRLVQRGVHLMIVQKWLGHKTIAMTLRYSHLSPTNFDDAVKVLEPVTERVA